MEKQEKLQNQKNSSNYYITGRVKDNKSLKKKINNKFVIINIIDDDNDDDDKVENH